MTAKFTIAPDGESHVVELVLSRRNLLSLLAKLDGYPAPSHKTIGKFQDGLTIMVTAAEDRDEYALRSPGPMHPATERVIARRSKK